MPQGDAKRYIEEQRLDWLDEHEYTETEDQLDSDEIEQAEDTLEFFLEDSYVSPQDPLFEFHFRAFLHNNEYSYSQRTIKRLIASVLGLD